MSKKSVQAIKDRRLASKMGMYSAYGGSSPSQKGHLYTKPGSGK